jgi:methionyl-tRNA formyltransferase
MAGDAHTGVCIMQMEAGLDTGPVLSRHETPIAAGETTGALHDRLSGIGAQAIVSAIAQLDDLTPTRQPEDGVTYAHKIDKAEAEIDWSKTATEVDRQIRGLSPFPGAWTMADGVRVKLLESRVADEATRQAEGDTAQAGQMLGGFKVACGEGAVQIGRAQRAGKSAQDVDEFLRGKPLPSLLGR